MHLHLEIPMVDSAVSRYLTPTYGQLEPITCLASLNISQKVHIQIEFKTLIKWTLDALMNTGKESHPTVDPRPKML